MTSNKRKPSQVRPGGNDALLPIDHFVRGWIVSPNQGRPLLRRDFKGDPCSVGRSYLNLAAWAALRAKDQEEAIRELNRSLKAGAKEAAKLAASLEGFFGMRLVSA